MQCACACACAYIANKLQLLSRFGPLNHVSVEAQKVNLLGGGKLN